MSSDPNRTVYIGNLDERVSDRVLYDILIQAGRVVDLHIPRDKETDKPKGFAFAEYETEEIADYAVRLFTGLVTLYNRTLRFGISGQDKATPNLHATSNSPFRSRHHEDAATSPLSRYANDQKGKKLEAKVYKLIKPMEPDFVMWSDMLGTCRKHGEIKFA